MVLELPRDSETGRPRADDNGIEHRASLVSTQRVRRVDCNPGTCFVVCITGLLLRTATIGQTFIARSIVDRKRPKGCGDGTEPGRCNPPAYVKT
jgi:hypothetical protein